MPPGRGIPRGSLREAQPGTDAGTCSPHRGEQRQAGEEAGVSPAEAAPQEGDRRAQT